MMITYSTNMMGPWSMDWYRQRGLTEHVWKKIESEMQAKIRRMDIGESFMTEEIITHYAGGRIDIRGLDESEFYNGWGEYSLPIMHGEDWNAFSDWLDTVETDDLWEYDHLIEQFEKYYGKKIRWADNG